jgi:lipopolysaccharide transport system permease protein
MVGRRIFSPFMPKERDMTMEHRTAAPGGLMPEINLITFLAHVALYKKYCGSWFGLGWSMLNPLFQIMIFYFAFKIIMRVPIDNYFVYLSAGMIPWTFLTASLQNATASIVGRKKILHSTPLHPWSFVLADISCELFGMLVAFLILLCFAVLLTPNPLHWLPLVPFVLVPVVIFSYAAGLIVAHLAVLYRDLPHLLSLFLSFAFWLMPVVYHWNMVPKAIEPFVRYNPMAMFIGSIQVVLHGGTMPSFELLSFIYITAFVTVLIAVAVTRKFGRNIIYRL